MIRVIDKSLFTSDHDGTLVANLSFLRFRAGDSLPDMFQLLGTPRPGGWNPVLFCTEVQSHNGKVTAYNYATMPSVEQPPHPQIKAVIFNV
jgi:hypothetical protein